MTPEDARKAFKRIYPEEYVRIMSLEQVDQHYILETLFPDGVFWFIVDECSVSNAYKSYADARRNL